MSLTQAQASTTNYWLVHFRLIWETNPPLRLHTRELDLDGNPQWHPEFAHWLQGTSGRSEGSEDRARLKTALKRLRERSLREYEVLYRVMAQGQTLAEVTDWLNERAIRGRHPERYSRADTSVIIYAAVDKVNDWF
jgi:hypothetical protein